MISVFFVLSIIFIFGHLIEAKNNDNKSILSSKVRDMHTNCFRIENKTVGSVYTPTIRSSVRNLRAVLRLANLAVFSWSVSEEGLAKSFTSAGMRFGPNSAYR